MDQHWIFSVFCLGICDKSCVICITSEKAAYCLAAGNLAFVLMSLVEVNNIMFFNQLYQATSKPQCSHL